MNTLFNKLSLIFFLGTQLTCFAGSNTIISAKTGKAEGTLRIKAFVKPHSTVRFTSLSNLKSSERVIKSEQVPATRAGGTLDSQNEMPADEVLAVSGSGANMTPWLFLEDRIEEESPGVPFGSFFTVRYTVSPF